MFVVFFSMLPINEKTLQREKVDAGCFCLRRRRKNAGCKSHSLSKYIDVQAQESISGLFSVKEIVLKLEGLS